MLELGVDANFALTPETVVGMAPQRVTSALAVHPMALADGGLAIKTVCYEPKTSDKRLFHIEIGDNEIVARDLAAHARSRESQRFAENDWTAIPMESGVLYLQGTAHGFFVGRGGMDIREVRIAHGLGEIRINDKVSARLRPSRHTHPVSRGNVAAVALSDGSVSGWLGLLHFDAAEMTARWGMIDGKSSAAGAGSFSACSVGDGHRTRQRQTNWCGLMPWIFLDAMPGISTGP